LCNFSCRLNQRKEEDKVVEEEQVQKNTKKKSKEKEIAEVDEILPKPNGSLSEEGCSDSKKRSHRKQEDSNEPKEENNWSRKRFPITKLRITFDRVNRFSEVPDYFIRKAQFMTDCAVSDAVNRRRIELLEKALSQEREMRETLQDRRMSHDMFEYAFNH
jgi:hypothetical protein